MKNLIVFLAAVFIVSTVQAQQYVLTGSGLTDAEKQSIVDTHNTMRGWIANATNTTPAQPKAGNMLKIIWDDGLAQVAQGWANKMILGHNPDKSDPRWPAIGENVGWGTDPKFNITRCAFLWFNEYKDYTFGPLTVDSFNGPVEIGHYTQVAWAKSQYVGCGASYFNDQNGKKYKFFVCNYGPSGNYIGAKPYYPGPGCTNLC